MEVSRILCHAVLRRATELGALKFGSFEFTSSQESGFYFDGRLLSLDSEGVGLLASAVVNLVQSLEVQAIGGPTIGADPIVGASLLLAHRRGYPLKGFLVRIEVKDHGMHQQVEGSLQVGSSVIVLDDVCSTGGSLLRCIEAVEAKGCKVAAVLSVLDWRHHGGSDELRRRGYTYITVLEETQRATSVLQSSGSSPNSDKSVSSSAAGNLDVLRPLSAAFFFHFPIFIFICHFRETVVSLEW